MLKKFVAAVLVGCCAAALSGGQAQAIEVLGEIEKSQSVETLGAATVKKKKELSLGTLRTREARLPGGVISQKDRVRLLLERLAARQAAKEKK